MKDPRQCPYNESHLFCRDCAMSYLRVHGCCPFDSRTLPLHKLVRNGRIEQAINELEVKPVMDRTDLTLGEYILLVEKFCTCPKEKREKLEGGEPYTQLAVQSLSPTKRSYLTLPPPRLSPTATTCLSPETSSPSPVSKRSPPKTNIDVTVRVPAGRPPSKQSEGNEMGTLVEEGEVEEEEGGEVPVTTAPDLTVVGTGMPIHPTPSTDQRGPPIGSGKGAERQGGSRPPSAKKNQNRNAPTSDGFSAQNAHADMRALLAASGDSHAEHLLSLIGGGAGDLLGGDSPLIDGGLPSPYPHENAVLLQILQAQQRQLLQQAGGRAAGDPEGHSEEERQMTPLFGASLPPLGGFGAYAARATDQAALITEALRFSLRLQRGLVKQIVRASGTGGFPMTVGAGELSAALNGVTLQQPDRQHEEPQQGQAGTTGKGGKGKKKSKKGGRKREEKETLTFVTRQGLSVSALGSLSWIEAEMPVGTKNAKMPVPPTALIHVPPEGLAVLLDAQVKAEKRRAKRDWERTRMAREEVAKRAAQLISLLNRKDSTNSVGSRAGGGKGGEEEGDLGTSLEGFEETGDEDEEEEETEDDEEGGEELTYEENLKILKTARLALERLEKAERDEGTGGKSHMSPTAPSMSSDHEHLCNQVVPLASLEAYAMGEGEEDDDSSPSNGEGGKALEDILPPKGPQRTQENAGARERVKNAKTQESEYVQGQTEVISPPEKHGGGRGGGAKASFNVRTVLGAFPGDPPTFEGKKDDGGDDRRLLCEVDYNPDTRRLVAAFSLMGDQLDLSTVWLATNLEVTGQGYGEIVARGKQASKERGSVSSAAPSQLSQPVNVRVRKGATPHGSNLIASEGKRKQKAPTHIRQHWSPETDTDKSEKGPIARRPTGWLPPETTATLHKLDEDEIAKDAKGKGGKKQRGEVRVEQSAASKAPKPRVNRILTGWVAPVNQEELMEEARFEDTKRSSGIEKDAEGAERHAHISVAALKPEKGKVARRPTGFVRGPPPPVEEDEDDEEEPSRGNPKGAASFATGTKSGGGKVTRRPTGFVRGPIPTDDDDEDEDEEEEGGPRGATSFATGTKRGGGKVARRPTGFVRGPIPTDDDDEDEEEEEEGPRGATSFATGTKSGGGKVARRPTGFVRGPIPTDDDDEDEEEDEAAGGDAKEVRSLVSDARTIEDLRDEDQSEVWNPKEEGTVRFTAKSMDRPQHKGRVNRRPTGFIHGVRPPSAIEEELEPPEEAKQPPVPVAPITITQEKTRHLDVRRKSNQSSASGVSSILSKGGGKKMKKKMTLAFSADTREEDGGKGPLVSFPKGWRKSVANATPEQLTKLLTGEADLEELGLAAPQQDANSKAASSGGKAGTDGGQKKKGGARVQMGEGVEEPKGGKVKRRPTGFVRGALSNSANDGDDEDGETVHYTNSGPRNTMMRTLESNDEMTFKVKLASEDGRKRTLAAQRGASAISEASAKSEKTDASSVSGILRRPSRKAAAKKKKAGLTFSADTRQEDGGKGPLNAFPKNWRKSIAQATPEQLVLLMSGEAEPEDLGLGQQEEEKKSLASSGSSRRSSSKRKSTHTLTREEAKLAVAALIEKVEAEVERQTTEEQEEEPKGKKGGAKFAAGTHGGGGKVVRRPTGFVRGPIPTDDDLDEDEEEEEGPRGATSFATGTKSGGGKVARRPTGFVRGPIPTDDDLDEDEEDEGPRGATSFATGTKSGGGKVARCPTGFVRGSIPTDDDDEDEEEEEQGPKGATHFATGTKSGGGKVARRPTGFVRGPIPTDEDDEDEDDEEDEGPRGATTFATGTKSGGGKVARRPTGFVRGPIPTDDDDEEEDEEEEGPQGATHFASGTKSGGGKVARRPTGFVRGPIPTDDDDDDDEEEDEEDDGPRGATSFATGTKAGGGKVARRPTGFVRGPIPTDEDDEDEDEEEDEGPRGATTFATGTKRGGGKVARRPTGFVRGPIPTDDDDEDEEEEDEGPQGATHFATGTKSGGGKVARRPTGFVRGPIPTDEDDEDEDDEEDEGPRGATTFASGTKSGGGKVARRPTGFVRGPIPTDDDDEEDEEGEEEGPQGATHFASGTKSGGGKVARRPTGFVRGPIPTDEDDEDEDDEEDEGPRGATSFATGTKSGGGKVARRPTGFVRGPIPTDEDDEESEEEEEEEEGPQGATHFATGTKSGGGKVARRPTGFVRGPIPTDDDDEDEDDEEDEGPRGATTFATGTKSGGGKVARRPTGFVRGPIPTDEDDEDEEDEEDEGPHGATHFATGTKIGGGKVARRPTGFVRGPIPTDDDDEDEDDEEDEGPRGATTFATGTKSGGGKVARRPTGFVRGLPPPEDDDDDEESDEE
uniref:Uncharacterized protein n=1 Tax=Chromera velia CCMP2878 TaxID=1169474 RepID=A0A0G4G8C9_9ALVE|eukprot:Cvel_4347.t1-p1 / transcript=Cvel_4347.t1 / gene=Cvel_4347 / organism=Chromera_velia_CCMP2878 / gene_product=hypothetical protein / transcript_product=hypothetical protein / location=Cvel_scaffold188:80748-90961(+) / protein_length=2338 / sequence_SO=supercontig / SO=protein_coding / is_pseudo=false